MDVNSIKIIAAAISILPLAVVAISLSNMFSSAFEAIGRNPSVADTITSSSLLYFAFIEAIALFCLLIALLILFAV